MRKLSIAFALAVSLTICATTYAAITGTTADSDGKPVAGATIHAYAVEGSAAMRARLLAGKLDREPLATAKSAENGSFSIELKSPAAVDLTIEAPGHAPTTIATVDADDLGMIVLGAPATRSLRVTSGGKAIANAIIVSGLDVARTNASGEAPAYAGMLFVVHPDYAVTRREPTTVTEIKLVRGVAVRGRVVKGTDPVAHAIVSINGWPLAESGDDGTFAIAHAPDTWQSISAVHGSDVGSATRSKAASVEIRLNAGATFTGTLRDAKGGAVAGARIVLSGPDDSFAIKLSDAKGAFTFDSLLPRAYQFSGIHPAYAIDNANVTVPATRSRAFIAQPFARARGHVIDEDRKPVAGALVSASGTGSARGRSGVTNAAGEFGIRVATGAAIPMPVYASKRGYVTSVSQSRFWKPGEVRDDLVITLTHGFETQVRVLDRQERPVPNVQVNVTHSAGPGERFMPIACADPSLPDCHRTGAEGIVALRTTEGRHDLMVLGEDVSPVRMPNQMLTARAASVVVHVDRGVEISGRVVLADGTPVSDAIVESPTAIMPRSATSASDGTFKIIGVAAGSAVVTAFSSDRRLSSAPVPVKAPANDVTITMPRGARIEGRVLDRATQQPVTDFTMILPTRNVPGVMTGANPYAGGQPIHADDGRYALDNVPPGTLQLMVRATGYVPATRGDITVEDGKTVSGIDVSLDRGATVSGVVTSARAPVAGVQVRLAFQRTPVFSNAATDADGNYTLDGLSEGDHTLEFQKSGFIVLRKPIEITAGKDQRLDAELDPGHELRGRVVDRSGQGVASVYVSTSGGDGRPLASVSSDGDGSFVLQGLADGTYKLVGRKDGFVSGEANSVAIPQSGPITLVMETGATITGRVTGLPPELFTQVTVVAAGGTSRNQTFADAGGNFSLPGMPDGRVRIDAMLSAAGQRRMAPSRNIVIENGNAPAVEMNFEGGITVSGHVTRANAPLPMGSLTFIPKPASQDRQAVSAMISPDGSYTAAGLAAGDYDVHVNANGVAFSTKFTATASATFDIEIRGATLRGHVVDASSGAPVANARVSVSSRAPAFGSALSDSDGRFTIDALIDDTYRMQVSSDQYVTAVQQIAVANGSVADVEVRLDQAPAVIIHLSDATTGSPVDGNVAVMDSTRAFSGQGVRIDSGTYKIWLKPGSYNASAYARGYIAKTTSFTTPPADVTITLSQGGALLIRAKTAQAVRLDLPGGGTQRALGMIQVGLNGPYESIPAGFYLLSTVGGDRGVLRSVPVTIVAGQTATVDLP